MKCYFVKKKKRSVTELTNRNISTDNGVLVLVFSPHSPSLFWYKQSSSIGIGIPN